MRGALLANGCLLANALLAKGTAKGPAKMLWSGIAMVLLKCYGLVLLWSGTAMVW